MYWKTSQVTQPIPYGDWKVDVLDQDGIRLFTFCCRSKLAAENASKLIDVVLQQVERIEVAPARGMLKANDQDQRRV